MTNLVALLIVTNYVRLACEYCDRPDGLMLTVAHEHQYERVVTTNRLPVCVEIIPRKKEEP
jgi:hypothetical protein